MINTYAHIIYGCVAGLAYGLGSTSSMMGLGIGLSGLGAPLTNYFGNNNMTASLLAQSKL